MLGGGFKVLGEGSKILGGGLSTRWRVQSAREGGLKSDRPFKSTRWRLQSASAG